MMTDVNIDTTETQQGRTELDAGPQIPIVDEVSAKVLVFTAETLVDDFVNRIGVCRHKTIEDIRRWPMPARTPPTSFSGGKSLE
jgi:hypothetical protein